MIGTSASRAASPSEPPVVATTRRRAHGGRRLEGGEGLLGVPRVAGAEDHPLRRGPGLQAVVAHGREGKRRPAPERAARQVAADRRAAHAADDQAVRLGGGDARRFDPEESVGQVVRQGQDIVQLVLRIDRADGVEDRAHAATMPGSTRASCSNRAPGSIRAPSPTIEPSSTTAFGAHLDARGEDRSLDAGAGADRRSPGEGPSRRRPRPRRPGSRARRTALGPSCAPAGHVCARVDQDGALEVRGAVDLGVLVDADAAFADPGGRPRSRPGPSRMSQLACR